MAIQKVHSSRERGDNNSTRPAEMTRWLCSHNDSTAPTSITTSPLSPTEMDTGADPSLLFSQLCWSPVKLVCVSCEWWWWCVCVCGGGYSSPCLTLLVRHKSWERDGSSVWRTDVCQQARRHTCLWPWEKSFYCPGKAGQLDIKLDTLRDSVFAAD